MVDEAPMFLNSAHSLTCIQTRCLYMMDEVPVFLNSAHSFTCITTRCLYMVDEALAHLPLAPALQEHTRALEAADLKEGLEEVVKPFPSQLVAEETKKFKI